MPTKTNFLDLAEGDLAIVPRGVEHGPTVPVGEAHIPLFEPAGTLNTGNVQSDRTVSNPGWL